MYISVNSDNEIKSVGISSDPNLTSIYIKDEESPFVGWSDAKICCYKVEVVDGIVMMMTPYIDSRLLDHIDQLGLQSNKLSNYILETQEALAEIYELIIGGKN